MKRLKQMRVFLVLGFSLETGTQDIVDYIVAETEAEACYKYRTRNDECEPNDVFDEGELEDYVEDAPAEWDNFIEELLKQVEVII